MKRIGMLTSGGDCQALNAAMRGVVKGLSNNVDGLEVYGFFIPVKETVNFQSVHIEQQCGRIGSLRFL